MNIAPFLGRPAAASMCSLVVAVVGICTAAAQLPGGLDPDPGAAETEGPPEYEVEFLIFAYNAFNPLEEEFDASKPKWSYAPPDGPVASPETLQPGSAELYLDDVLRPSPSTTTPAATSTGAAGVAYPVAQAPAETEPLQIDETSDAAEPTGDDQGPWYRPLDDSRLELGRAVARLGTLDAYTPLLHAGWSQAALLEDEAIAFDLGWLGRLQPAGSIRLHRSRFLHLTIDVSLQSEYRVLQAPIAADARWPLAEFRGPVKFAIQTQRRIRSEELHFFDHPAFGILVIVRPLPEELDAEDPALNAPAA